VIVLSHIETRLAAIAIVEFRWLRLSHKVAAIESVSASLESKPEKPWHRLKIRRTDSGGTFGRLQRFVRARV
jgi:hypothetical protein